MKVYRSGGDDPRIPELGIRWRRNVSFMLRPLYTRSKCYRYVLDRGMWGVLDITLPIKSFS